MTTRQLLNYFSKLYPNQATHQFYACIAADLGVTANTIDNWVRANEIPESQQFRIEVKTRGELKAE